MKGDKPLKSSKGLVLSSSLMYIKPLPDFNKFISRDTKYMINN